MSDGERELIERAKGGDREALDALLHKYQAAIYRFGLRLCRDEEDAEDIAQETMFAMANSIEAYRGDAALSTWLYTIARSHCIKKRRRSKFAPTEERSLDDESFVEAKRLSPEGDGPDEALIKRELESALSEAIDSLEPAYREVLILRDVEGFRAKEASEILGISVSALKSRLHRARITVRDAIAPLLNDSIERLPSAAESCPDIPMLYSQHLEGEISASLCATMEAHLASCERCDAICDSLKNSLALCQTYEADAPIPDTLAESIRARIRVLYPPD